MTPTDSMTLAELVTHAQRVEALGYEAMWVPDMFGREIYLTAGHVLANTARVTVGTGIAHIYGRDPVASVQAARTLSELSGGRFVQGLGLSHPNTSELRGAAWEDPVDKARRYLTAMRGEVPIRARADIAPVPIYLAAHGPKMLAVAGECADGAMTYMQTPESCAAARAILGPDKVLNLLLPTCLTTDTVAARATGRRALRVYLPLPAYQRVWARSGFEPADWSDGGSERLLDTYLNWGDLDTITARIRAFLDAGVTNVIVAANPVPGDAASAWTLTEALAPG